MRSVLTRALIGGLLATGFMILWKVHQLHTLERTAEFWYHETGKAEQAPALQKYEQVEWKKAACVDLLRDSTSVLSAMRWLLFSNMGALISLDELIAAEQDTPASLRTDDIDYLWGKRIDQLNHLSDVLEDLHALYGRMAHCIASAHSGRPEKAASSFHAQCLLDRRVPERCTGESRSLEGGAPWPIASSITSS